MAIDQFQDSETVEQALFMPYLPEDAKEQMRNWMAKGLTVFQSVVPQFSNAVCKNCGDLDVVYVTFCKAGPIQTPRYSGSAICWFDGRPTFAILYLRLNHNLEA